MSRDTKFASEWKNKYPWFDCVKGEIYATKCNACYGKIFSSKNIWINQVE